MIQVNDVLNNPLGIQRAVLSEYEAKLDGQYSVVDANNSFTFLLEAFSRITSDATNAIDTKLNGLYPIRANTTKELFNHLSDFDYVGFFSYPAALKLSMMLHRDFLVKHAVQVPGTNYQLVVIPSDTIFNIGRFSFGLYYPIHIKINTLIETISASYDTTEFNPLKSLATNTLEVRPNTFEGIDLVTVEFETYQFDKRVYIESINPSIGFMKKYQYDDRFYAIRVYDITDGQKKEVAYTLSDSVYDVNRPTVNLKVYPETNEIGISVPQIYFTKGILGSKIQLEVYTTLGSLDVSLTNLKISDITANFAMNSPNTDLQYTDILKKIPTIIISPVATRIVGGSNSYTFTQMKDFTIYHNNALSVPITRMDLDRFFSKNGFVYMAKIDNLTDRRYYAYKKLYLENQELGVTEGGLTILFQEETSNNGVLYQNNDTIVILPTVIYKYLPSISKFEILDDTAADIVRNATGKQLAIILNNNDYFCNPHHIVITTLDRYPACELYDLFTTEVTNITFIEENIYLSAQLSLITIAIRHLDNGSGGYVLRAGMMRSEDLIDVPTNELNCYLTVTSKDGYRIGVRGEYVGKFNGIDVFDFHLVANYKIKGNRISVTNFRAKDRPILEYEIFLSGTMHIATFVKKERFPNVSQNTDILMYLTDDDDSWLSVSHQSFEYRLGSNLSDIIDSNLLTNWTKIEYESHIVDMPLTYEHDVYERNDDGTLKYTLDPVSMELSLNKLHSIGDIVYDSGEIVYKYREGDLIIDAGGSPIQKRSRIKDFTIDLSTFAYSHRVVSDDFFIKVSADLFSYYETIREMNLSVLENTDIYFKPIVTTSKGRYRINNSTTIESYLELSFEFNCFVAQTVLDDATMLEAITERIIKVIMSHLSDTILSLTDIAASIRKDLGGYINSIDAVSLNGDQYIQTLMNVEIDKSPKLGTTIIIGRDGRLTYSPNIVINYKALDL